MFYLWVVICLVAGIVSWKMTWGRLGGQTRRVARRRSPEETLKRRFARGEIDESEFKRRMAALHDS